MKRNPDIRNAPPPFEFEPGRRAVFVEYQRADHHIRIDAKTGAAVSYAVLPFRSYLSGYPIFDLEPAQILAASLDGSAVGTEEIASPEAIDHYTGFPDAVAKYRVASKRVDPGRHVLEIHHRIARGVHAAHGRVRVEFAMTDSHGPDDYKYDREFLERYLPGNLEFDRHPVRLAISIENAGLPHVVYANGSGAEHPGTHWIVRYPPYFNCSSIFLLIGPADELVAKRVELPLGRHIEATVVGHRSMQKKLGFYEEQLWKALPALERRFGVFPYQRLLVGAGGDVGMEYAAAVRSGPKRDVLFHELVHNYFGRCVAPVDGDAGWIDEAIAGWAELGFEPAEDPPRVSTRMGRYSPYRRETDACAWEIGPLVASYLDHRLRAHGGLTAFLRRWFAARRFTSVRSEEFQADLEAFSGVSFQQEFDDHVYGEGDDPESCIHHSL